MVDLVELRSEYLILFWYLCMPALHTNMVEISLRGRVIRCYTFESGFYESLSGVETCHQYVCLCMSDIYLTTILMVCLFCYDILNQMLFTGMITHFSGN